MTAVAQTLTVRVPLAVRKRGGRKLVITPDVRTFALHARVDVTLVKAVARAFRWRRMLESGKYNTIDELAAGERINSSYVSRILRLTLLAPDIVEAILDGRHPEGMVLPELLLPFPIEWDDQRAGDFAAWRRRRDDVREQRSARTADPAPARPPPPSCTSMVGAPGIRRTNPLRLEPLIRLPR
jgi:hypothetical protein